MEELSVQQIADCTSNPQHCGTGGDTSGLGCKGGVPWLAFESIKEKGGIASEWTYPYVSYFGVHWLCTLPGAA